MLEIQSLHAGVEGREILHGINLKVNKGEVHVILGSNGSGKSTLMNVIMGHPKYEIMNGTMTFDGEDLTKLAVFERARRGIFLSFQTPEEIPGITVENMLRSAKQSITGEKIKILPFKKQLKALMQELKIDPSYAERYMNVGFSGGEKKRNEILQLLMLEPKLALDGGIDGLDFYRRIADDAPNFLYSGGFLAVEIGINQADDVKNLFAENFVDVEIIRDLAGIERVVIATYEDRNFTTNTRKY